MDAESRSIKIHTAADFAAMRVAGRLAADTLDFIADYVVPGVTTDELDRQCAESIAERGGISVPLNYRGFPKSICTSMCSGVRNGAEAPPGIKAFKGLSDRIPPPKSSIKSRNVAFTGNS